MDDPKQDDKGRGLLYVKSICMVCRDRTYNCPYCDGVGTTYIEASDTTVARWINNLNLERIEDIMKKITKGNNNGTG